MWPLSRLYVGQTLCSGDIMNKRQLTHSLVPSGIHSFTMYLLSTYYAPSTALGIRNTIVNKGDMVPAQKEESNKQHNHPLRPVCIPAESQLLIAPETSPRLLANRPLASLVLPTCSPNRSNLSSGITPSLTVQASGLDASNLILTLLCHLR